MTAGPDARRVAFDLLRNVVAKGAPLAPSKVPAWLALSSRDRAFSMNLVHTILRRAAALDAAVSPLLRKPLTPRQDALRDLLRLGAAQILLLETPAYAAIDSTVSLARATGNAPYAGLLNAVLRRLTRQPPALADLPSGPDWLTKSWRDAYGAATAQAIAVAHAATPPLDLTARTDPAAVAAAVGGQVLPTGTVRCHGAGMVSEMPGYAAGDWWVQDAAAALPARLLGNIAGADVLDICAAPGGKTAQLAAAGATVTAVEQDPGRLATLTQNLDRLRLSATTVCADARAYDGPAAPFVLLDAPCTATGTIRRHPDIPYIKRRADIAGAARLQDELLDAAVAHLPPGGLLVYAVCSLQPEEGPARVTAVLDRAPLHRRPITAPEVPGLTDAITTDGDLRTLPCDWPEAGGLDGFFIARLIRD